MVGVLACVVSALVINMACVDKGCRSAGVGSSEKLDALIFFGSVGLKRCLPEGVDSAALAKSNCLKEGSTGVEAVTNKELDGADIALVTRLNWLVVDFDSAAGGSGNKLGMCTAFVSALLQTMREETDEALPTARPAKELGSCIAFLLD